MKRPLAPDAIPEELRTLPQWVLWRWESKGPSFTKVPYALSGRRASSTDPGTWSDFESALTACESDSFSGVGFVVTPDDPFCGIDLDDCLDPATGELTDQATSLVDKFSSYTEVTPSVTGLRIWIRASKLKGRCSKAGLEVYDSGRYFTVTGWQLDQTSLLIGARQSQLGELLAREFPTSEPAGKSYSLDDSPEAIDLVEFLTLSGVRIIGERLDGTALRVFKIVCPWVREHTNRDTSGTRVGQYPDGALFFHCEHAHCSQRKWPEFRREVSPYVPNGSRKVKTYARRTREVSLG